MYNKTLHSDKIKLLTTLYFSGELGRYPKGENT